MSYKNCEVAGYVVVKFFSNWFFHCLIFITDVYSETKGKIKLV